MPNYDGCDRLRGNYGKDSWGPHKNINIDALVYVNVMVSLAFLP
jgi:hypothetical protein